MASKYHARKVSVDGITFDSKKEARRWSELKLMESAGIITDLQRQVTFQLLPSQKGDGRTERPVKYVADFTYQENGKTVVEDTKGMKTKDYIIKRKLMRYIHGITIKEV